MASATDPARLEEYEQRFEQRAEYLKLRERLADRSVAATGVLQGRR